MPTLARLGMKDVWGEDRLRVAKEPNAFACCLLIDDKGGGENHCLGKLHVKNHTILMVPSVCVVCLLEFVKFCLDSLRYTF